jgi:hypothetical protein
MPENDDRYKFMRLLISEQVGDVSKRNILGYKPTDIDHSASINQIPEDLREHFLEMDVLSQEADYMIITNQTPTNMNKKEIVIKQLEQLGLVKDSDFKVYVMKPDPYTQVSKVLISIKISQEIIDKTAEES